MLYPVALYFVLSNLFMILLNMVWVRTAENYDIHHMIVTAVCFPFIYALYPKTTEKRGLNGITCTTAAVCAAATAIALNGLLSLTPLVSNSASYREISSAFFGSTLWVEVFAICVLTPILEETLYRGIAYVHLREWLGVRPAIVLSSMLFGLMHFNLVQFIYASLFGLLLAYLMEHFGLIVAIMAHAAGNLIGVLNSEIGFLAVFESSRAMLLLGSVLAMLLAAVTFFFLQRRSLRQD